MIIFIIYLYSINLASCLQTSLDVRIEHEFPRDRANDMVDLANIAEISVRRVIDMAKKVSHLLTTILYVQGTWGCAILFLF